MCVLLEHLYYTLVHYYTAFNLKENRIEQLADEVPLTLRSIHKSLGLDSRNWVIEYVILYMSIKTVCLQQVGRSAVVMCQCL